MEDTFGAAIGQWEVEGVFETAAGLDANVVSFHAQNNWGWVFFNSDLAPKHPRLGERDFLREAVQAVRKHDLRLLAMVGPTPNQYEYQRHPDWAQRNRRGEVLCGEYKVGQDPQWPWLCINSPYRGLSLRVIGEILENYAIDGLFPDYLKMGHCHCEFCREAFRNAFGLDIPEKDWSDPAWPRYIRWRKQLVEEYMGEIKAVINEIRPETILLQTIGQFWASGTSADARYASPVDVIVAEGNVRGYCEIPRASGMMIDCISAVSGKPIWGTTGHGYGWYTGNPNTPQAIRQELRETVSHGASPWILFFDWELVKEKEDLDEIGSLYRETANIEVYLENSAPFHFGALVYSESTRDWYGRDHPERYLDHFRGWYEALTNNHWPIQVITESDLTPEELVEHQVLILPNVAALSDESIDIVQGFVQRGGGLAATYETSLYDQMGNPRTDFGLKQCFGAEYTGMYEHPWSYVRFDAGHPIAGGWHGKQLLQGDIASIIAEGDPTLSELLGAVRTIGHQVKVQARPGSQVLASLVEPVEKRGSSYWHTVTPPIPGGSTGDPCVITNTFGRGRVVYFAGQPGRHFWRHGYPAHEAVLLRAVRWAANADPPVEINAPPTITTTVWVQQAAKRVIIHLVNHSYNQLYPYTLPYKTGETPYNSKLVMRPVRYVVPAPAVEITIQSLEEWTVEKVFSALSGREFSCYDAQGRLSVAIPQFQEYELAVVQFQ
jgi:hypothetical protein